jgi:hypothetical protein
MGAQVNNTFYEVEYLTRIYEPYVFLFTNYGTVDVEFKGGETLTLFKTVQGAVKYFEHPVISVEEYYGDPTPHVDYVKVASPGVYPLVDISDRLFRNFRDTVYGRFFDNPIQHPTYGEYVGWAYFKPIMVCRHCGGDTTQVDMEYLSGQDHLDCVLAQHA